MTREELEKQGLLLPSKNKGVTMFEKEAIRHAFEVTIGLDCLIKPAEEFTYEELNDHLQEKADDFQDGAEFGYNKAKEETKNQIAELKTKKIPQLERKIASIRGCHSVDAKKLNARIEQVERLKKENAELRDDLRETKKLLAMWIDDRPYTVSEQEGLIADTEQFLKEE